MTEQEALALITHLLASRSLNYLQRQIFLKSWLGQSYQAIAVETHYDDDYIKALGAQLWDWLSEIIGARVTKKNVRLVLEDFYDVHLQRVPPHLNLDQSSPSYLQQPRLYPPSIHPPHPEVEPPKTLSFIEFPNGAVPLNSPFYISRAQVEDWAFAEIKKPGSLIRIKAPHQMGKTSLILRILEQARSLNYQVVLLDMQEADQAILQDTNRFLRWFCLNIGRQLGVESKLSQYWDEDIGSKQSCTIYFKEYLLQSIDRPIVIALDEVHNIFEYPTLAKDFLPLLRTWHEEAAYQEDWRTVSWIVAHSTESYVPLNLNHSPFNVGLPVQLSGFTLAQVQDLAQRHNLAAIGIPREALQGLVDLTSGHPSLIRLALYWLCHRDLSLEKLLQDAATQSGIYRNHLRWYWNLLKQQPTLWEAFSKVIVAADVVPLEANIAYRLESLGLVKLQGNKAMPSCELYRQYFRSQLSIAATVSATASATASATGSD